MLEMWGSSGYVVPGLMPPEDELTRWVGHVFFGEPGLPGGVKTRHCVNGIRLQYKEEGGAEDAPGQGPAS